MRGGRGCGEGRVGGVVREGRGVVRGGRGYGEGR